MIQVCVYVVSRYAVDEYEALQADLELEKDLRVEAENFAHKVSAHTQSQIQSHTCVVYLVEYHKSAEAFEQVATQCFMLNIGSMGRVRHRNVQG